MKARLLIASMALCALCGLAVAQEYCVRANRRINLRDAASLQGVWLETVAAGTTLTVIGEQNRWLKINRNGSEVWMASWVDYSRLDNCGGTGSQPGTSAGTANIDNCCFVDRQCHTDQDWTEGYYAFQDNQCPAPGQTGSPSPSQPASGAPAQIDNCCFVDRQCSSALEWAAGWHAFQDNQCGAPGQSPAPASPQPVSGAPAQIDNCCFVDRQCRTELDWAEGYYAFRNNQCPAPGQSPAPASPQPVSGAPAHIDNCCFVDRQCHTDLDWAEGYHAFQNNQCGARAQTRASTSLQPASARIFGSTSGLSILPSTTLTRRPGLGQTISFDNCCDLNWQCKSDKDRAKGYEAFQNRQCSLPGVISIVGDADFVDFFAQRLHQLRIRLPHRYDYVLRGLDKLQQAPADLLSGHVGKSGRTFYVPWSGPSAVGWEKRMSAVLVHEACHIHRYDAGYRAYSCDPESQIREETICREIELEVVIELDAPPDVIEWVRGMVADTRAGIGFEAPAWC